MTPIDAQTIEAGTRAAEVVSKPAVLTSVLLIVAVAGCCLLVWRDEQRADAQIHVMERMADEIGALRSDFQAAGIRVSRRLPKDGE